MMRHLFLAGVLAGAGVVRADAPFIRGDIDRSESLAVTDAVGILRFLFQGDPERVAACDDAADADDDGSIVVTDAVYLLEFLFLGGEAPPFPYPLCGEDPTDDALACEEFRTCSPQFTFLDEVFAGEGVVFVLDRSGSMQDSGEMGRAKQEVLEAIESFPEDLRFGFIFSDAGMLRFPQEGELPLATESAKEELAAFVTPVGGGAGSCPRYALITALELLDDSVPGRGVVLYIGDGGGTCAAAGLSESAYLRNMVETVTARNGDRHQINAIGVLMRGRAVQRGFLEELTARNGGIYIESEPPPLR